MRFPHVLSRLHHRTLTFSSVMAFTLIALPASGTVRATANHTVPHAHARADTTATSCTTTLCTFSLGVNPGLLAGKPFACPAIQDARATITITNRFANNSQNDFMFVRATGLPPNTGFDLFLVQNSPLDGVAFPGFGSGWYQSDLQSNSTGSAAALVQGIFDVETFIENPANAFSPIHTYNVGFWFNSPTDEQRVCGNATAPAATPFNGEQHAGLLAMITRGEPLQSVH